MNERTDGRTDGRTREREPRPGLPPGTRSRRVPPHALGTCRLSSRPLRGAPAVGPRGLGEDLPLRGGAGRALRVRPRVPGPAGGARHQRLRDGVREDAVDAAPDRVREGEAGRRSAARYRGAFSGPPPRSCRRPDRRGIPAPPGVRPPGRPLGLLGPLCSSYSRKKKTR